MSVKIDILNESTVLTKAEVATVVPALNMQLARDVEPAWGIQARTRLVAREGVHPEHWVLALLDDADMANALGYHETRADGLPLGKVFVKTTKDAGLKWTATLSHELIEMVCDPEINLTVVDQGAGKAWCYEACDACEADALGYDIGGVRVSDFVYPAYFELWRTIGPFDHQRHLTGPLTLAPGGYLACWDFATRSWMQANMRPGTSRGERRRRGLVNFRRSTVV